MDVRLLVVHNKPDAKEIRLGPQTLIGRSPDCNLRIASGQISRRHCIITVSEPHVLVRDLGSANGTRLNGRTIDAEVDVPIPPGSTLVVGPLKFVVKFAPPPRDDDTALLECSALGEPSGLRELQALAPAPVADGEETKDYPPTRARKRGAAPPVVVVADSPAPDAGGDGSGDGSVAARSTESDFSPVPSDTVYDESLGGGCPPGPAQPVANGSDDPAAGFGTQLLFEEDELGRLAAAIERDDEEGPAPGGARSPNNDPEMLPSDSEQPHSGWRLLDRWRRPRPGNPPPAEGPPAASPPSDDVDESLRDFLKDQ